MSPGAAAAPAWWQDRERLRRFVCDLLAGELARERRATPPHAAPWADALKLDADLGVDSLERLGLAAAVNEALHLHVSGIEDALLMQRELGGWLDVAEQGLACHDRQLTFRTSGSTGVPRPCVHDLARLEAEAAWHARNLAGTRRVLSAVPSHHIYGFLFNLLLPRALGLHASDVVDLRTRSPGWLARHAVAGDLVVGHPVYWQAVQRAVPWLAEGVVGVTSTAPCPDALAEDLARSGLRRLLQVYGSTETAGIATREAAAEPFTLMPGWALPDDAAEGGALWRDGVDAPVPIPDEIERIGERQFRVGARRDGAVQVGGVNVYPQQVAAVLRQHPRVADASVRLMTPEEGTRLKAFIVPREIAGAQAQPALEAELRAWVDHYLSVPNRPRALTFGPALPRTQEGKLADWSIEPL